MSILRRYDRPDAGATKRARPPPVTKPLPYAQLTKLVVIALNKEDAGLLPDLFHANGALKYVKVFCVEC
jgi:hypothetical protein